MFMRSVSVVILSIFTISVVYNGANAASGSSNPATNFSNPEPVVIQGYSGPAEDAFITPDNKYLFFDSHNDAGLPIYLYWATRIDYKTFSFGGQIQGLNCPLAPLRGNYATPQNFYFFCLALAQAGQPSIASGQFSFGTVTNFAPIRGITLPPAVSPATGRIMLDGEITSDGNTLYFTDWQMTDTGQPVSGQIKVAARNANGTFTVLPNSAALLSNVNATGTVLFGSVPSTDNLTLYFTVSDPSVPTLEIYVATRTSTTAPFGLPQPVAAADVPPPGQPYRGVFVEMGSTSSDGNYLYYHRLLSSTSSQIYVMSRSAQ